MAAAAVFNKISSLGVGGWIAANFGGVLPLDTDRVLIRDNSTNVEAGLDQSLIDLNFFKVADDCTCNWGTATSDPFRIDVTNAAQDDAAFHYFGKGLSAWIHGTFTDLYIHTRVNSPNAFVLSPLAATPKTTTRMTVTSGKTITISGGGPATVTTLIIPNDVAQGAVAVAAETSSVVTNTEIGSGHYSTYATTTAHNQSGGRVFQEGGTTTYAHIRGGYYAYKGGTVSTTDLIGGVMDLTQTTAELGTGTILWWGGQLIWDERIAVASGGLTVKAKGKGLPIPQGKTLTLGLAA